MGLGRVVYSLIVGFRCVCSEFVFGGSGFCMQCMFWVFVDLVEIRELLVILGRFVGCFSWIVFGSFGGMGVS